MSRAEDAPWNRPARRRIVAANADLDRSTAVGTHSGSRTDEIETGEMRERKPGLYGYAADAGGCCRREHGTDGSTVRRSDRAGGGWVSGRCVTGSPTRPPPADPPPVRPPRRQARRLPTHPSDGPPARPPAVCLDDDSADAAYTSRSGISSSSSSLPWR